MDTRMCVAESLCCAPEIIRTLSMGYTPIKRKFFKKKEIYASKKKNARKKGRWTSYQRVDISFLY